MRGASFAAWLLLGLLAGPVGLAHARAARADAPSSADLVRALGGEDVTQRYDAYTQLLARRPPDALPLLAKAVPTMPVSAQSMGLTLVQMYPPADARPVLERFLGSDAPYLRVAAGAVLLRQGEPKAGPAILKVLGDPTIEPATLSLALGQLQGLRDAKVLAAVRGLLRSEAPVDVLAAALTLLHAEGDEQALPAVKPLLEAPVVGVRALAGTFLLAMGDETQAEALSSTIASGELPYLDFLRLRTLLGKAPRCPDRVLDALVTLIESDPKGYALSIVVITLGSFAYPKAAPLLRRLLDHADATVSKAAFEALCRIPGAMTPEVTRALLTSKDETRRVSAAEALRRADDPSGLAAVIDVLAHGSTARADAARALGTFRSRAAVGPLIEALLDADLSVRAGAFHSLLSTLQALFPYRRIDLSSTGYTTTAAPDARAAAVGRIRAWWAAHENGRW